MLPLEKQQSERKLFHHSALPGGGFPYRKKKRGRRRKQLLDDVKEREDIAVLQAALNRTLWRNRLGRSYGLVARQATKWINAWRCYCT